MENKEIFESMSIKKAALKMCLPLMTSLFIGVIYNMADTFFISQTGDANQVAAVGLAAPIFMLLMALGNIFGIGGSAFISRTLGENNHIKAKKISVFCFYSSVLFGIISTILLITNMDLILKLLGSSPNTHDYCKNYLYYYILGAPFVLCNFALADLIRGEGASRQSMIGNIFGSLVNIILDPIMILGFNMGITGAAIATVIGNICAVAFFLIYIIRKSNTLSISIKHLSIKNDIILGVMAVGIPASINNILLSTSIIVMNNFLTVYGDSAIAAMGIANKVISLITLLLIGFSFGIQPLLAYSYGCKNANRLNSLIHFAFHSVVLIGTLGGILIFIFSNNIMRIFINDIEIITYGSKILKALSLSTPIVGIVLVLSNLFQAMGKGIQSTIIALSRQGILFIPILIIMNYSVGFNGIILTQAITDLLTTALAITLFILLKRKESILANPNSAGISHPALNKK